MMTGKGEEVEGDDDRIYGLLSVYDSLAVSLNGLALSCT